MGFFDAMGLGAFGRGGGLSPGPYGNPWGLPSQPMLQQGQGPVVTAPGGEGQFGGPPPWMQPWQGGWDQNRRVDPGFDMRVEQPWKSGPWTGGMPWQQMPGLNPTQQRDLLWRSGRAAMPLAQFSGGLFR